MPKDKNANFLSKNRSIPYAKALDFVRQHRDDAHSLAHARNITIRDSLLLIYDLRHKVMPKWRAFSAGVGWQAPELGGELCITEVLEELEAQNRQVLGAVQRTVMKIQEDFAASIGAHQKPLSELFTQQKAVARLIVANTRRIEQATVKLFQNDKNHPTKLAKQAEQRLAFTLQDLAGPVAPLLDTYKTGTLSKAFAGIGEEFQKQAKSARSLISGIVESTKVHQKAALSAMNPCLPLRTAISSTPPAFLPGSLAHTASFEQQMTQDAEMNSLKARLKHLEEEVQRLNKNSTEQT